MTNITLKFINKLILFLSIPIFLTVGVFVGFFFSQSISKDIGHWAQFGDFFGGVLNPILAFFNLSAFIYLTYVIHKASEKKHDVAIETNKKIALMNLKYEEFNHFKRSMDESIKDWNYDLMDLRKGLNLIGVYNNLEDRMLPLFPELQNSEINKSLKNYIGESIEHCEAKNYDDTTVSFIDFLKCYYKLISDLSKSVIDENHKMS